MEAIIKNYNGHPNTININEIITHFTNKYNNIATRAKELSKFKKRLMELTPVDGYNSGYEYNVSQKKAKKSTELLGNINDIKMNTSDAIALQQTQLKNTESKTTFTKTIPIKDIKKILRMKSSKDIWEQMIYLTFTTGRRSSEMLSGTFKTIRKDKTHVLFTGILKNPTEKDTSFNIPVIGPASVVVKISKKIHAEFPEIAEKTVEEIGVLFGARLLKKLKNIFPDFTVHSLRSLYISYLFQYLNPENHSKTYLIKNNLLHGGLNSIVNYNNYEIV